MLEVKVISFSCLDCGEDISLCIYSGYTRSEASAESVCYDCNIDRKHQRAQRLVRVIIDRD